MTFSRWRCISGCGACCRLDPELRGDALAALSAEQRALYLSLVGPDGWCIHFDTGGRRCRIYSDRPDFCRVENLVALFGGGGAAQSPEPPFVLDVGATPGASDTPGGFDALGCSDAQGCFDAQDPVDADALAIACCTQQIRAEMGGRGRVMRRFRAAIRAAIRQAR